MRIDLERHGDVQRLRMQSMAGRVAGVDVSVYVVRHTMIDSSFHGARDAIVAAVSQLGVEGVIVTHWHEDHAGNVETLARRGIPISLRHDTEVILRRQASIELYRRLIWRRPPALTAAITEFEAPMLESFHTPGHSVDHQVVWDASSGTLFSGDLWLGPRVRVLHADEDPREIVRSLRKIAGLAPDRMFDAHRGLVARPVDALHRRAEWITEKIGDVERLIGAGITDSEILKRLLGGEEMAGYISFRNYSRLNFVRAVRRGLRVEG